MPHNPYVVQMFKALIFDHRKDPTVIFYDMQLALEPLLNGVSKQDYPSLKLFGDSLTAASNYFITELRKRKRP